MAQVTLVAMYGEKPAELQDLIGKQQELVTSGVGSKFAPYAMEQVHATIMGMGRADGTGLTNHNFRALREEEREMDIGGFLNYLRTSGEVPFAVQVGGFENRDYPFTSRRARPYERSFSIQSKTDHPDIAVMMSWPVRGQPSRKRPVNGSDWAQESRAYPNTLDGIRNAAKSFGILHGYHAGAMDVDNDLFFRIGLIERGAIENDVRRNIERDGRMIMSLADPLVIEIGNEDLFIAKYESETLDPANTRAHRISNSSVSGDFVASLYDKK